MLKGIAVSPGIAVARAYCVDAVLARREPQYLNAAALSDEIARFDAACQAAGQEMDATIARVTDDFEKMSFNTAISRLMEFTNAFLGADVRPRSAMETFTLLLSPMVRRLGTEWAPVSGWQSPVLLESASVHQTPGPGWQLLLVRSFSPLLRVEFLKPASQRN